MRHVLGIITCLCLSLTALAHVWQPVRWTGEKVGDSLLLTATVDSGWHLTILAINEQEVLQEYVGGCSLTLAPDAQGYARVRYNACDDEQCTSPETFTFPLQTNGLTYNPNTESNDTSLWWLLLMGLLGGVIAIFTPCVWPIIPMTVSLFLKRGGGLKEALLFGLSIIVIYVGLGLIVTLLFGASALNAISTSAPLNIFFFLLLVVFALSFFGLFDLTLPASWSTVLDKRARTASGWMSIVFMAFTLVIVSFSCTGPIIGTLLVQAASNSLLAPAIGMLGFAIALAIPFTLFALFPQWMKQMPRSGEWMQTIKVTLAFVELAFSLKFLSVADMAYGWGILPRWLFITLWIICAVALGIYLTTKGIQAAKQRQSQRSVIYTLSLLCAALLSFAFAFYLIPGLRGAPVKAIAAFAPPQQIKAQNIFTNYEEGMLFARQENKPILLHFTGYGCVNCRQMEASVLDNEEVKQALNRFVCITLYVDSRRDENNNGIADGDEYSLLQRQQFGSNAQPQFLQLTPDGIQSAQPFFFSTKPEEFLQWLQPTPDSDIHTFTF